MRYVKKPIPIEAIQYTGDNIDEILEFMFPVHPYCNSHKEIIIQTLEGEMAAPIGSYIIRGIHGEYYPCRGDIFEETYEPIEN